MACFPWFHEKYAALANESWSKSTVPSGCSLDNTANVPCDPAAMRAKAEAWLAQNAPQALALIGGSLSQLTYTFARYMHSEVGSGTIEERVAVGEAAINRAQEVAGVLGSWKSAISTMLTPSHVSTRPFSTGRYGAIHVPASYCDPIRSQCAAGDLNATFCKTISQSNYGKACNAHRRWASTSRDPSVMSILLAHLVISGESGDFANGAQTQWGPDSFEFTDGSRITSPAQVQRFVKVVANQGLYWVGPLAGVDPWHTFLVKKMSSITGAPSMALAVQHLPMSGSQPVRPNWGSLAMCSKPLLASFSPTQRQAGKTFLVVSLGLAAGAGIASLVSRRYLHPR